MASIDIRDDSLVVGYETGPERWFAPKRGTVIPLEAVRDAEPVDRPLSLTVGARSGMHITGFTKIGTWGLARGRRQLVCAYRDRPGIRIRLDRGVDGVRYDELIVSTPDADRLARELRNRAVPR